MAGSFESVEKEAKISKNDSDQKVRNTLKVRAPFRKCSAAPCSNVRVGCWLEGAALSGDGCRNRLRCGSE